MTNINKHVMATGKSLHAGHKGVVTKDYGHMLLIKADDEKYSHAYKREGMEGKYFQLDARNFKEIKDQYEVFYCYVNGAVAYSMQYPV